MQETLTLEIAFSVNSEEEKTELLTGYFNGVFPQIIIEYLKDGSFTKRAQSAQNNDSNIEEQLTELIGLLKSSQLPITAPNQLSSMNDIVTPTPKISSRSELEALLDTGISKKKNTKGGLFGKKPISRV